MTSRLPGKLYRTSTQATSNPKNTFTTAAINDAPNVSRYDATTRGELTATALTETFLNRIKAVDHKIASFITVTEELARNAARQADMEMKGGLRRGPMHGRAGCSCAIS